MKLTSQGFKVHRPPVMEPPAPVMTPPRILMLILASDNSEIFLEHQSIWRSYMHSNPTIKAFFYKANPSLKSEFCIVDDVLWVRCEESLDTVYEKTLKAFDAVLPMLSDYDFVFRPNLSSFVVLDKYLEFCKNLPGTNLCAAFIGGYENIRFPAGAGFTLSCDLVRRLTEVRPPLLCQDDVSIGQALQEWGTPIHFAPRTDIASWESYMRSQTTGFHYRLKHDRRHNGGTIDEEELRVMIDLRDRFYRSDTIEVVMRMCRDGAAPISGGDRPSWFTKEKAFQSMFLTKDDQTRVTVLFDGDSTGHWIHNYSVGLHHVQCGNGDASFLKQLDYMKNQAWSDTTIVYCLEDDYMHRPGWCTILREGLSDLIPSSLRFDYITLYDHFDKYTYGNDFYKSLTSRLGVSRSTHWRTIPSTTNTWCTRMGTFRNDFSTFWHFKNQDHEKFLALGRNGRVIGSPVPGYSTHCHSEHLAPGIKWELLNPTE